MGRLLTWADFVWAFLLSALACTSTWNLAHRLPIGLRAEGSANVWFEADPMRVFYNLSARHSSQVRSQVHPVFALLGYSCDKVFQTIAHLSLNESANAFLAFTAGIWAILMFLVIRKLGFDRILAIGATLIGLLSAAAMFFFPVPETYSLGSVSILATLAFILFTEGSRWEPMGRLLASATSLSITVTNWSLGLLLTFRKNSWRRWLQLSINGFFLIAVLWSIEKFLMPSADFFTAFGNERRYLNHLTPIAVLKTIGVFVFHTVIAPAVQLTPDFGIHDPVGPIWKFGFTFQNSLPGSASVWGAFAAVLWAVFLVLGIRSLIKRNRNHFSLGILTFLIVQLILHSLYGIETFLYALDWLPILIIVAITGIQELGKARWFAMAAFIALVAVNNVGEFQKIAGMAQTLQRDSPLAPPTSEKDMTVTLYWSKAPAQ